MTLDVGMGRRIIAAPCPANKKEGTLIAVATLAYPLLVVIYREVVTDGRYTKTLALSTLLFYPWDSVCPICLCQSADHTYVEVG
jgi:hypothetical protein